MEIVFYLLTALGSSSLGYSLLRTGFPKTQALETMNKILYGYALGLVVVLPAIATAMYFGAGSFFLMLGVIYGLLFAGFIAKRFSFEEKDDIPLVEKEKDNITIPRKILKKENKVESTLTDRHPIIATNKTKTTPARINTNSSPIKIKEQIFKEKQPNVIAELREKTTKIEEEKKQVEKENALKKMKSFAKQIEKNKNKKKNYDEIDEDELSNLGEGF